MKKRMLSSLLILVLFLSIAPITAFGATTTMTLVQKTTGEFSEVDKEFVYYIPLLNIYTDFGYVVGPATQQVTIDTEIYSNVEVVTERLYRCRAGDDIFARESHDDEMEALNMHMAITKHNAANFDTLLYKITLKNGQSVEMKVTTTKFIVLGTDLEDDYSLLCTVGDKATPFPRYNPEDDGFVTLTFEPETGGTITLKQSNGKESEDTNTNETSFPDVPGNSDYAAAIGYVSKKGVMVGDDQGRFNPDTIVSRAEMATIVCRVLEQTENLSKSDVFSDVPAEHWANTYIGKASELGIVNGYGEGKFGPSDDVAYEQAVTMIVRAIGEENKASSYGGYPNGYLLAAQERNLLEGIQAVQGQGLSRGWVAVLLYNYYTAQNDPAASEDGHTHNWANRSIEEVGHKEVEYVTVWTYKCNCGLTWETDHRDDESVLEELDDHMAKTGHGRCVYTSETKPSTIYVIDTPAYDETYCTLCGVIK